MATREKNSWIMLLFILAGLVIGGLLGNLAASVDGLSWLAYGDQFGLESPLVLDLSVLTITFAFTVKINLASIIGVVIALLVYRKV